MFDEEGFVASLLLRDDEVGYDWRWVEVEVVVCDGSVERLSLWMTVSRMDSMTIIKDAILMDPRQTTKASNMNCHHDHSTSPMVSRNR